jgi:serine/threonine protein kinase
MRDESSNCRGAFGLVFQAQSRYGKSVAIKCMLHAFTDRINACAAYREVRILGELRGHHGFVQKYEELVGPSNEDEVSSASIIPHIFLLGSVCSDGMFGRRYGQPHHVHRW